MGKVKSIIRKLFLEELQRRRDYQSGLLSNVRDVEDFDRYEEVGLIYVLSENPFFMSFCYKDSNGLSNVIVTRTALDTVLLSSVLISDDDIDKFVEMIIS